MAVAARGQAGLDALCSELAAGDRLVPLAADVGDAAQADALVERAIAALGGLDVLIANATANREGRADDDYQASFAVDLMQAVRLVEAVRARQPRRAAVGRVHVVDRGQVGRHARARLRRDEGRAARVHEERGRHVRARGHARERRRARRDHVRGRLVGSGAHARSATRYARTLANIPRGQMGAPEEVADVVCFLASKRAAHVNGATVLVDGGEYKGYA